MNLDELQDLWIQDSRINETDLGREATRVPMLHSKYLKILTTTRLQLRKYESQYLRLRGNKLKYFRGELSREELTDLGWEQYLGPKPLRTEVDDVISTDEEVIKAVDKVEYMKTMMYQLEQIIRSINSRTWDVKSAIEYFRFTQGSM